LFGILVEFVALWIGIAFTGVRDFGSHWVVAGLYFLGTWPERILPVIPASSCWSDLSLIAAPVIYGLIGMIVGLCYASGQRRHSEGWSRW